MVLATNENQTQDRLEEATWLDFATNYFERPPLESWRANLDKNAVNISGELPKLI